MGREMNGVEEDWRPMTANVLPAQSSALVLSIAKDATRVEEVSESTTAPSTPPWMRRLTLARSLEMAGLGTARVEREKGPVMVMEEGTLAADCWRQMRSSVSEAKTA